MRNTQNMNQKPILMAEMGMASAINVLKNVVASSTILAMIAQEGVDAYNNYGAYKKRFGMGQPVTYLFGASVLVPGDSIRRDADIMSLLDTPTKRRNYAEAMDFVNVYLKPFVNKKNLDNYKKISRPSLFTKKSRSFVKTISTQFAIRATKLRKFFNETVLSLALTDNRYDGILHYQKNADSLIMTNPAAIAVGTGGATTIWGPDYHSTIPINPKFGNVLYAKGFNSVEATLAMFIA